MASDSSFGDKIVTIVERFETENKDIREERLIRWSRNEHYWKGFQYLFWSSMEGNWKVPSLGELRELDDDIIEDLLYSKVINIYKSHGQSIVAALSVDTPGVKFFPDDADDPEDVQTAKAYSKMAELIQRHNKAKLLIMHALYIMYNQDFVAARTYKVTDKKFGTFSTPVFGQVDGLVAKIKDEETPKSRVKIDVYGPLQVQIPPKAKTQDDVNYLVLELDQHPTIIQGLYGDLVKDVKLDPYTESDRRYRDIDRIYEDKLVTVKHVWLEPSAYYQIGPEEDVELLKSQYPEGCYAVIINGVCIKAEPAILKDEWTITYDPMSSSVATEPLGESLIPLQDIKNDLTNYTLQTIEYGIPETFADIRALNWEAYRNQKSRHGQVFPARKPPDGRMDDNFTTIKTTNLSREVQEFNKALDSDAQFVSGDYPSIYGGPSQGSKTLGEYAMSRNQALQRLSSYWTIINFWWADVMEKSCNLFRDMLGGRDENFVVEDSGNFVNVWIRSAELQGSVGNVEPESSEKFPLTTGQKRDMLIELITLNNEAVNSVIFAQENAQKVSTIMGFGELSIPGENQLAKQIRETQILMSTEPIDQMTPSIMPDQDLDDHGVHAANIQEFLVSFRGQELQQTNPLGYLNCLMHFKMHKMFEQMQMMQEAAANAEPEVKAEETENA